MESTKKTEAKKNAHGGNRGGGRPALREDRVAVEIERKLLDRLDLARAEEPRWILVTKALESYLSPSEPECSRCGRELEPGWCPDCEGRMYPG